MPQVLVQPFTLDISSFYQISGSSGPQTQLPRRQCAHAFQPAPPGSRAVAPGVSVAHAAMRRLVQQGHKQRDHQITASQHHSQPTNSEPLPEAEASSSQQH